MLNYTIKDIAQCTSGTISGADSRLINSVLTDSRGSTLPLNSIFFALHGPNHDGHEYIQNLIQKGVRCFVVDKPLNLNTENISVIQVKDTLEALQFFARKHRESFNGKILGITGSNGKTIIKEWMEPVLSAKYSVSKSPKSYNSQIGVALSILQADSNAELHLLEAGISEYGEMERLANMIQPDYGLITNIGDAHQENFDSQQEKLEEKLVLFNHSAKVYYSTNHIDISNSLLDQRRNYPYKIVSWGNDAKSDLTVKDLEKHQQGTIIKASYSGRAIEVKIPFQDQASIENLCHIWTIALDLGIANHMIQDRFNQLEPIAMRMEQKEGINGCSLINDYYNSDFHSVQNAIDLLFQQTNQKKKTLIISDILQTGDNPNQMIEKLGEIIKGKGFTKLIGIGPVLHMSAKKTGIFTETYPDTEAFLKSFSPDDYKEEAILLKGARRYTFEQISTRLEQKVHRTVLRINMPTLLNNLNGYRNYLNRGTKIMGMVKAFGYGSGTHEVARYLAHQQIDYLAVAFVDEGILLRQAGVKIPIMVMNPDYAQAASLIQFKLEPEVYSLSGLLSLKSALKKNGLSEYPVHLKIDTGMHRLGFLPDQLPALFNELITGEIKICSIFSHLAAADDAVQDSFTRNQISTFISVYDNLVTTLGYRPLKHILNTAGIERFPEAQFDMVRLGIGLYGVGSGSIPSIESPIQFESYISQIHELEAGETIGYGRKGKLESKSRIGIVPVGYADGFDRRLGHGNWSMRLNDSEAPTIGQICMDMCMINLTHIKAEEGDVVTITDSTIGITKMAEVLETIPYEILTGFSQRIKRIYEFG